MCKSKFNNNELIKQEVINNISEYFEDDKFEDFENPEDFREVEEDEVDVVIDEINFIFNMCFTDKELAKNITTKYIDRIKGEFDESYIKMFYRIIDELYEEI